jgi:glyoxylate reductase
MPPTLPKVFVIQAVPEEAVAVLRRVASVTVFPAFDRTISRTELLASARGCDYLWALGEIPVDGAVMDAGPLKMIAIMEILSRAVEVDAATARGIPVTTLPNLEIITTSTAELAFSLIQALTRRLPEADRLVRDDRWTQYQSMALLGTLLEGKVLGIVGLGNVGRKLARRAQGSGMRVVYTDRSRFDQATERRLDVGWLELDELMSESDVIALTPTLTASSVRLIDGRRLGLMKPTAYLVNTSRGPVLDEGALVDALAAGQLAGAALDVFETEPPTPGGGPRTELRRLDNVILTPHLGTATVEARREMALTVVANLEAAIAGRRPRDVINPEVYGDASAPALDRIG